MLAGRSYFERGGKVAWMGLKFGPQENNPIFRDLDLIF